MTADLRLAIPAAAAWSSAAVLIGFPTSAMAVLIVAWLASGLVVVFQPRIALVLTAIALVGTSVALHHPAREPAVLMDAAERGSLVELTATTTQTIVPGQRSFQATVDSVQDDSGSESVISVAVLVFGEVPESRTGIGTTIAFSATVASAEPGDDRAFLVFPGDAPTIVAPEPPTLAWANDLRARMVVAATELPGEGGALLPGLAIGDTTAVSPELDAAMKSSSLSHLTAVSGANCAIVIGLILLAGAALGVPRAVRIIGATTVLIGFVVLVTPEPSVLRAAIMATLVLAALLTGRPVRGLPVLSLTTLMLVVMDPWLARNYGFILSVLATAGLLLLAGPIAAVLERWLPRWAALTIAVPFAAQIACQPVIVLLNASLPTYGVIANVLAAPAAPVATVIGLAACVCLALAPPLGLLLCQLAWLPSAWIAAVAHFFATAPGAALAWPEGWPGAIMLAALGGLVSLAILGSHRLRRWSAVALVTTAAVYSGIAFGQLVAVRLDRPDQWQIAGCDVGQGDAFLVRSKSSIAMIDTGPDPALASACLEELDIHHLDLLVLTHFDHDHVGGVSGVAPLAERILIGPTGRESDERIVEQLSALPAVVDEVRSGPTGTLGELRWSILWPPTRLAGVEPGNGASVTMLFEPAGACIDGCFSSIFLGDLGETAQNRLLSSTALPAVDVVKVSHHGSADQSAALYERLAATVGLIGVGLDNGYGHPTATLLDVLDASGTVAVRTDQSGLILLSPDTATGAIDVWTER